MSDDADKAPIVAQTENDVVSTATKPKSGGPKKAAKKVPQEDVKYEIRDIVLARLRGYPPWPARIVDPDDVPANVLSLRPKSAHTLCAQFFPVGDYAWLHPRDISHLKPHQIDAFINEPHRKASGALRTAYKTAQDPTEWYEQMAAARLQVQDEFEEEDVDELEEEEDEEVSTGKRKRAAAAPKKDAKKAKTSKKAPEPKAKAPKAEKPKSDKSKAEVDESGEPVDPEAIKVKDWRHKLQRAFLVKGVPEASEMDTFDKLFTDIEAYDGMKVEYLQYSKIGKVLKKIAALDTIPRNDELKITSRATKLMNKWQNEVIVPSGTAESANGDAKPADTSVATENNTVADAEAPAADTFAEDKAE